MSPAAECIRRYPEAFQRFKTLIDADRAEVDKDKQIDPEEEMDWYSLSLGFFLASGLPPADAHTLSCHCRHDLRYWEPES